MKTKTTPTLPFLLIASILAILPAAAQENETGSQFVLDGTWILRQQIIALGAETYPSPLNGRTLVFSENGSFTEDYSTEQHSDPGLRTKIKIAGTSTGAWRIEKVETGEVSSYRLLVRNEIPSDNAPRVEYEGKIRKAGPSLPLGFGRTESFDDGRWVVCDILVETDADGATTGFEISNGTLSKVIWSFGKEGYTPTEEGVLLSQASSKQG